VGNEFAARFLYALANLPGNLASFYLIETLGRRRLLAAAMGMSGVCAFLFAAAEDDGMVRRGKRGSWMMIWATPSSFHALNESPSPPRDQELGWWFRVVFCWGLSVIGRVWVQPVLPAAGWNALNGLHSHRHPYTSLIVGIGAACRQ
jgi:hypothetical protein